MCLLQRMFADGSEVILVSKASGKTLRSYHGTAEGIGGHGTHGWLNERPATSHF